MSDVVAYFVTGPFDDVKRWLMWREMPPGHDHTWYVRVGRGGCGFQVEDRTGEVWLHELNPAWVLV